MSVSCIDHFLVTNNLWPDISHAQVLHLGENLSNHEPIFISFKVDVHGENIAFFIVSYDFPSFFLPFFLLSIGSKIWVCWENGNFRSEKWENGNPNYANRKGFQKVTFGYFTSRIQSTCAVRLRFSKFALDLLKSP